MSYKTHSYAFFSVSTLGAILSLGTGCTTFQAQYVDPSKIELVNEDWSDSDARLVTEAMIKDMVSKPWLTRFSKENKGEEPKVLFSDFENRTAEHIDTKSMFEGVRAEILNSGRVRFLDGAQRQKILKEYAYQNSGIVRKDQVKSPGKQLGADFLLAGTISGTEASQGGHKRVTYQVQMRLTNIETSEIVWEGRKDIAKNFDRSRFGK